ncbi:triokinase/FMN cyclase isoform X1 [Polypterus senegalus]|uniref:triokinase/FMN cyclase isoform X1 n=2 Tax=Polypterus senegalus TaxID=55291 RepID=UPI00196643B1|nr:triokinase/FMN cyclase isoform X1 [Polypterus senegalus]
MEVHKKLLNSVEGCVDDALLGLVTSHPGLSLLQGHHVVLRSDLHALKGKVALLSGGGSGHEPAHAGYVGQGMLSGVVAGAVFTSPPPGSILAAIRALTDAGAAAVLLIVKNYTGDRLNFGLALEQAKSESLSIAMVIVSDDCAFTTTSKAGRRGLCGTVLIHKIAGALAEEGRQLEEIVCKVNQASKLIGTLGVCLNPCSVPGSCPTFHLASDEIELGLGIHGEPGIKRTKLTTANEVVKMMIDHMTDPSSQSHLPLSAGNSVVLVVNNLGGLSCLELAIVTGSAIHCLESRHVVVARVVSGTFMTALEMSGVSLTLMVSDDELLRLFDSETRAPAWPATGRTVLTGQTRLIQPSVEETTVVKTFENEASEAVLVRHVLQNVCSSLLALHEELNALDRAAGDGDCGSTHSRAALAIQDWLQTQIIPASYTQLLSALAKVVQEHMGGSSGALYSLFLTAAAQLLRSSSTLVSWADAVHAGTEAIKRYGGAEPGDRTMLDALCPAVKELQKLHSCPSGGEMEVLERAVQQAELGAQSTRELTAQAGRASYIDATRVSQPDPGAVAIAAIFKAILCALRSRP